MKLGDGLFLNTCKRVAEEEYGHTGIKFDSMIVDNTAMQLVSRPQQFDVMVMVSAQSRWKEGQGKREGMGEG
jgi:isocitrate dehydrogenase (NAD+)